MKAVLCDKTGGPEVLRYTEDQPVPKVGESEVLVKNKFGGINYIDTYYRTGLYPAPSWPLTLGQEGVGTVAAVGGSDVHGLKENDEVVYLKQGKSLAYCAGSKLTELQDHTLNIRLSPLIESSRFRAACPMTQFSVDSSWV